MTEFVKYIDSTANFYPQLGYIAFDRNILLDEVLTIANVTTGELIYNFACEGETGTTEGNILYLFHDVSTMSSDDVLIIIIQEERRLSGENKDEQKVVEQNSHLLKEILQEQRTTNKYLADIVGDKLD